MMQKAKILLKL